MTSRDNLLIDSSTFINFYEINKSSIKLLSNIFNPLILDEMVTFELSSINRSEFSRLGISIVGGLYEDIDNFFNLNPPLSFYDILFLNTSIINKYKCATNDYKLQSECQINGLLTLWVMDLVVMLKKQDHFSLEQAQNFLNQYKKRNKKFTDKLYQLYTNQLR